MTGTKSRRFKLGNVDDIFCPFGSHSKYLAQFFPEFHAQDRGGVIKGESWAFINIEKFK